MNMECSTSVRDMAFYYKEKVGLTITSSIRGEKFPREWKKEYDNPTSIDLKKKFPHDNKNIIAFVGEKHNLVAIDFDLVKDIKSPYYKQLTPKQLEVIEELKKSSKPWVVRTPSGAIQLRYRPNKEYPLPRRLKKKHDPEYIDLLGNNGVVPCPPSFFKDKETGVEGFYVSENSPGEMGVCPTEKIYELLPYLKEEKNKTKNEKEQKTNWEEIFNGKNPDGTRNDTTIKVIGKLIHCLPEEEWNTVGWNLAQAYDLCFNENSLIKTYGLNDLKTKFEGIKKAELKKRKIENKNNGCEFSNVEQEEEEKQLVEVIKYLSGDVIKDKFLPLTEKLGLVGEESLKVTSYLCGISRLTNELNGALHCRVVGDSGMGKSKVMEFVGENFIGSDFIERASLTVASIYRRGPEYFKHKILFQSELLPLGEAQEEINGLFRTLKTKGKAERDVTTKKGKDLVPITLTVEGPTSQWGTTTRSGGRDEDLNRDIILNPDNSREQTFRIQKYKMKQRKKYDPNAKNAIRLNLLLQNKVQEFLKANFPECVEIPYSEYIKLPNKGGAARRDPDKITRLIESCCQLNILNRAFKILNCANKIDEVVNIVKDFRRYPLHQTLNAELASNSDKFEGIDALMKSSSEMLETRYSMYLKLQEIEPKTDDYLKIENAIIKKQDDDILLFTSDPAINYIVLKEFIRKNTLKFVLISDTRDFEIVKEYCAEALESPYQKLSKTHQEAYRKILEALPDLPRNKEEEAVYHCTTADVEDILECSNHWAWDVLKKLTNEGYCTCDKKKTPHIYNFTKSKLAKSFDKEGFGDFYKLELKPFPEFQKPTSSDLQNEELKPNSKKNQKIASDEVPSSEVPCPNMWVEDGQEALDKKISSWYRKYKI